MLIRAYVIVICLGYFAVNVIVTYTFICILSGSPSIIYRPYREGRLYVSAFPKSTELMSIYSSLYFFSHSEDHCTEGIDMDRVVSLGKRSAGDNDPLLVPLKRQKTVSITDLEEAGALSGFTNHVSLLRKHSGRASLRRSLPSTRRVVTSGTSGPEGLITGRPISMCPTEAARNDECAPMEVDPGTAAMETCGGNSQDCAGTTQVVGDATDAAPGGPLEDEVRLISGVHPQCDPEYIREQLQANLYTPDRVSAVVFGIYDNPDYPTLAERQAIERQTLERQRLQNISLNIGLEQFLRLYTNPVETFYNEDTVKSDLYGEHAATKLRNDFRNLRMTFIRQCLRDHGGHLTPTYHKLKEEATKCPESEYTSSNI